MELPQEFIASLGGLVPDSEVTGFIGSLGEEAPVAVRFNPFKIPAPPEGNGVPWCRYGFYLDGRASFTLDPLHHAGAYYVQEPSSMFVEHVVRELYPDPVGLRILDMCAAPGGKTTLLATLAGLEGLVVANETVSQRASVLAQNVRRWGLGNTAVTANDPAHFKGVRDFFDIVLVDAPCSGEGMFRKDPEAREHWSPANVEMCAARQRRILAEAWGALKPGGTLIYSTCTFNRAENENTALWFCDEYAAEPLEVEVPTEWGITLTRTPTANDEEIITYRFYPHRTSGEGFTLTALRKPAGRVRTNIKQGRPSPVKELPGGRESKELSRWVSQPRFMRFGVIGEESYAWYDAAFHDVMRLSGALNIIYSGVHMGRLMNGKLRPEHSLALFHDTSTEVVPTVDLPLETALDYLRKKDIPPTLFNEGINLVAHNGYPLGWVKRIGNRLNNNLPKELRIANL